MKIKKFNGFDENGYLPYGMYNMTLNDVENIFSKNQSLKRMRIMEEYKKYLNELKSTGYFIDHWIDGSFVTSKENPQDIDTLTEFDGVNVDKNNDRKRIDDLIFNSKSKTNNCCHSFRVYLYPPTDRENYQYYLESRMRILINLFGSDPFGIQKGIIHLIGD